MKSTFDTVDVQLLFVDVDMKSTFDTVDVQFKPPPPHNPGAPAPLKIILYRVLHYCT